MSPYKKTCAIVVEPVHEQETLKLESRTTLIGLFTSPRSSISLLPYCKHCRVICLSY